LEIEGEGSSQKIKVLTKREYHHLLTMLIAVSR
jgi:hypothetical protein